MSLSRFPLLLLVGLVATACSLPTSKKTATPSNEIPGVTESTNASFYLTSLEGKFTNLTYERTIGLPGARQLTVTACFKDKARKQEIIGHRFAIRGGEKEELQTTNGNACIIWREEIKYNFLADEKYVEYAREIVPQGIQKGSMKISLIINPWSDKVFSPTTSVVVNTIRADAATDALLGKHQENKRTIFVENVRANIVQDKIDVKNIGGRYNVDVAATLMGERYDFDNARVTFDLLYTPQIYARIQLMCVYHKAGSEKPHRAVIAQLDNVKGSILNAGRVTFSGKFALKEYCASTATLMLGITARVNTENPLVTPFNGIFILGQVQYTIGMGFSLPEATFARRFMDDRSTTVEDFLAEGETTYRNGTKPQNEYIDATIRKIRSQTPDRASRLEKLKASPRDGEIPEFLQAFNIELASLALEPYQYEEIRGYANNIRRQYRARACLQLGIDANSIRNVNFELTKINGEKLNVVTQNNGCFEWIDSVTFNYLAPECRMENKKFNIKSASYGIDRDIDVLVNPWISGNSSAPVVLWFSGQDKELPKQQCVNTKSQIIIGYYYQDYYVDRFNYSLDKYLGLSHMRMSNMALIPKLKRPTFGDRRGFEDVNLPVGRYLLRYAIVDQHVSDYRNAAQLRQHVYTVHRSVISVRADGTIADLAPMETAPDAIASLGALNQLIVEVVPMKEEIQNVSEKELKAYTHDQLEALVDKTTAIEVSPHAGQLIFQSESGGFRQIPEWQGQDLVKHLEVFYKADREEVARQLEWVSKKENAAKAVGLTLINLNSKEQVDYLTEQLGGPLNRTRRVSPTRFTQWITGTEFDNNDLGAFCSYFFGNLWRQPLTSGRSAYKDKNPALAMLRDECMNKVGHGLLSLMRVQDPTPITAAIDIEWKYFVKDPEFVKQRTCVKNARTGSQDCDSTAPMRMARQTINISENFFVSRDYGTGYSHGWEGKGKAEFGGAGGGWGISVGSASVEVQGNSKSYSKGMTFDVDALTFRVKAKDVERCISIRLNPALVYKKDRFAYLWVKDSMFAKALRPDLTDAERNEILSRGLMICEGQSVGRPVEFDETYYFIRSGSPRGMVADTMSSRNFNQWFTSLRGVKDFANFRSLFQNTYGTPETYEGEVDPDKEGFAPIQANFARGSRSMPGVYSTHKPLNFR